MTLKYIDGFEINDQAMRWPGIAGNALIAGRYSTNALQLTGTAGTAIKSLIGLPVTTSVGIGLAVQPVTATNGTVCLTLTGAGTFKLVSGAVGGGGTWSVTHSRNGNPLTSPGLIPPVQLPTVMLAGAWVHFEILFTLSTTVGRVSIKANGNTIYDQTMPTYNDATAAGNITTLTLSQSGTTTASSIYAYDDLWVSDGSLHGDQKVVSLYPTGDTPAASLQWTPSDTAGPPANAHFPLLNTAPTDVTSTLLANRYVSTTAGNGLVDYYTVTTTGITAVTAVQLTANAYKTDAGAANLTLVADATAGTPASGVQGTPVGVPTTPGLITQVFPTATAGAAWTPTLLGHAVGVKSG